jgi:F-type H+-transporting ATPase subunit gamma
VYNSFVSAISYESRIVEVYDADSLKKAPNYSAYELEDDELVGDLVNFSLANAIYVALVEGYASEVRHYLARVDRGY